MATANIYLTGFTVLLFATGYTSFSITNNFFNTNNILKYYILPLKNLQCGTSLTCMIFKNVKKPYIFNSVAYNLNSYM